MRIQHNIMAMNAYRNYSSNTSALAKNLEKLSSGYKINRAGDDAAGLAISEKMRAQITGLKTAQKNAKDGISLIQTAEGALTEVHDMLNRMVELADQSANGTYDDSVDRANLQKEFDALRSEIDRISEATNFNGIDLLNGKQETGANLTELSGIGNLPGVGSTLGTDTVLHSSAAAAKKTSFGVDLHNVSFDAVTGDKVSITIGQGSSAVTLTATATGTGAMTATAVVAAIKGQYTGNTASTTLQIGGQDFVVSGSGTRLTFTQKNAPTSASQVVSANQKVTISAVSVNASASVNTTSIATGALLLSAYATGTTGGAIATAATLKGMFANATSATTNITATKVKAAADAVKVIDATNANVTFKKIGGTGADADYVGMYIGDTMIGKSAASFTGVATNSSASITFVGVGSGVGTIGKITVNATAVAVTTGAITSTTANNLGITFTSGDNTTVDNLAVTASQATELAKLVDAKGANGTSVQIAVASGGKYQLMVGNTVLAEATLGAGGALVFKNGSTASAATIFTATVATGTAAAVVGTKVNTGVTVTPPGTVKNKGDWNVSTTVDVQGAEAQNGRLASTKFTLDKDKIVDGGSIRIGDKSYTIALGSDSKVAATATDVLNLRDLSALASDATASQVNAFLDKVGERLTVAADTNSVFTVGHQGDGVITVTERVSASGVAQTTAELDTKEKIAAQLGYSGEQETGKGLTLQIGDTSDSYNQLTVSIKNMNCESLGIDASKISISDQTSAQAAVSVLKNAINSVSSTRGDLGAMQNRLEHTINNLSVMQENIQDAEATIRDVDVAEEMMAYTKNNILVQSAQAMLAQANQVPQGVLQLLQ